MHCYHFLMSTSAVTAVAIVIVSWESAGYLSDAVASAQASLQAGDQIIIWDNASSADTQTELDAIARQWPTVIIKRCSENLGFAVGNNRAIALAEPEHDILCLNPDAQLKPGTLAAMRAALVADQQVGAVGAIQLTPDELTIDGLGDRYQQRTHRSDLFTVRGRRALPAQRV